MQHFIEKMPKAELHVHLEGTLEPELSFELANKNGVELAYKTPEALVAAYDFYDLPSFLAIYYAGMRRWQGSSKASSPHRCLSVCLCVCVSVCL